MLSQARHRFPAPHRVCILLCGLTFVGAFAAQPPATPELCAPGATAAPALGDLSAEQPASTRRMAARLREIAESESSLQSPFLFDQRVAVLAELLGRTTDPKDRARFTLAYAGNLLRAGHPEEAIPTFAEYERLLQANGELVTPQSFNKLQREKGMSHLRLGELENCLHHHNADSCLLPIRGGGVHQLTRGSRGAIAEFTTLLERQPGDIGARWLLNIAYMTLGEYPEKVPTHWLVDPKLFESDHDIKRFPDVARPLGIDVDDLAGGVVMDDIDRDGLLDLVVSSWGLDGQLRTFRNNGDGSFTERTKEAGLLGEFGGLNLLQGDYNNDGFLDLFVLRGAWLGKDGHHPNSLLRNNGNGTFTDVTEEAGVLSFHPTQAAAWFDYNGDGWLDVFIGNESEAKEEHPCELYRNNGDGTFTNVAADANVAILGFVKGVVAGDYNNDGRPDLYLSRRDGGNHLLRNDGPAGTDPSPRAPWRFTEVAGEAGVREPFGSFSCWFWDFDNDGWLDLACTGYHIQDVGDIAADVLGLPHGGERMRLYRNRGDGTFADVTQERGLDKLLHTMGCNFGDLDNDGWLDFYCGTGDPDLTTLIPNRMFRSDAGGRFQDVTTSGGFGQLQKGHGIAFGDIDNDGDQDIYSVVGGAISSDNYPNQLFANPGHGNRWLKLELEGVRSNRLALGARIKVVVKTDAGERAIHRTVGSGGSFGASPLRQEIGLGQATAIVRTEIFWPATGVMQVVPGLEIDRAYKICEGAPAAMAVNLRTFPLPVGASAKPHHHHAE